MKPFNHKAYIWRADIDYRKDPKAYRIGKGEQGVLLCEPYKSEILPHWRFKTKEMAKTSSQMILKMFYQYLKEGDFIGADMARKFLQMGYTRARRYTNYAGGRKYHKVTKEILPRGTGDPEKAKSATIFYAAWQEAKHYPPYRALYESWQEKYG